MLISGQSGICTQRRQTLRRESEQSFPKLAPRLDGDAMRGFVLGEESQGAGFGGRVLLFFRQPWDARDVASGKEAVGRKVSYFIFQTPIPGAMGQSLLWGCKALQ